MAEETKTTQAEETKTTQAEETKTTKKKALVEVHIPRGAANDEPNMFVCVNGKGYLLPKGKTSKVPPEVAAEIARSKKAQDALDNRKDEMIAKAK